MLKHSAFDIRIFPSRFDDRPAFKRMENSPAQNKKVRLKAGLKGLHFKIKDQAFFAFALNSSLIFSISTFWITGWKFWLLSACLLLADLALSLRFFLLSLVTDMIQCFKRSAKIIGISGITNGFPEDFATNPAFRYHRPERSKLSLEL